MQNLIKQCSYENVNITKLKVNDKILSFTLNDKMQKES